VTARDHGCASIKSEGLPRHNFLDGAPLFPPERLRNQDSGNLRLNHFAVELRSTKHRFGLTINPRLFLYEHPASAACESAQSTLSV
jgi:hypothetical protein